MDFENALDAGPGRTEGRDSIRMVLLASAVTVLFWFIPLVGLLLFPIRIFVTYVHEFCHAFAALLSLGWPHEIEIYLDGSGVTMTAGGLQLLISSAGYVGTPLIGAGLLLASARRRLVRPVLGAAGLGLLLTTVLLGGNILAWVSGLAIGVVLVAIAAKASQGWAHFSLAFLSVQLILNAFSDLKFLLFLSMGCPVQTDAQNMANATGGLIPAVVWTVLWALLAAAVHFVAVRMYLRLTVDRRESW